jgi:Uma2 family endonuclease
MASSAKISLEINAVAALDIGGFMSSVFEADTVADLIERLGGIPASRILLHPAPGTATEKDAIEAEARTNRLCELWDGVLVAKPMGFYESRLAIVLSHFLESYLEKNDIGFVLGADAMLRVLPNQVRLPDVSYFSWEHFPNRTLPPGAILDRVPDLAVEILSPTNTVEEMKRKRREYFGGGTKLVRQVDPPTRTVEAYSSPKKHITLTENDTLDGGIVLPGFELAVKRWFARAGRRGKE